MKSTDELLNEYRQAYGLETQTQDQAQGVKNPFEEPVKADFNQKIEQDRLNSIDWMYKSQGMDADPTYTNNAQRRAEFDNLLNSNEFIQQNKDKLMDALEQLRKEVNNPDSPIDLNTASELFIKLFNEEIMNINGDKKDKKE